MIIPIHKAPFFALGLLALAVPAFGQFSITTPSQLPNAVVNKPYSVQLAANQGTNPITFAFFPTGQSLPPGISLDSSGMISGTAQSTTGSPFTVTIRATDNSSPTKLTTDKTFTLTVIPELLITDLSLPNATVGAAYSKQINVTGGIAPYISWSAPALPSPLTINSSGLISGTPTSAATTNNIIITVGDSSTPQLTTSRTYSLTIGAGSAPNFTTTSPLPQATQTKLYSQTLAATGGTGALTYSLTPANTLPTGLTLSTGGVLSGTPSVNGSFTFSLRVTDAASAFTDKSFSLTINPVPLITTGSLPNGSVGIAYSTTLAATGGTAPLTWTTTSNLTNGLSFNNGVISGTPTGVVTFPALSFTVTDANGTTASASFSLTINPALSINNASPLPSVTVNTAYNQTITATGGASSSYVYSVAGGSTLPTGLGLTPQGTLSGTPTAAGTFSFTLQVTDSTNVSATKTFQLTVNPAGGALTITTNSPLPAAAVNSAYSQTLAALGGSGTGYSWAVAAGSTLPPGLTLSTAGLLSGPPTTAATSNFTVQVTDSANTTVSKSFLLTVNNALSITTASPLPSGSVNAAYSQTLQATGGTGAYTYTLAAGSTLPSGLSLSTSGIISGTPLSPASPASFTVQLTDSAGNGITKPFQLTINASGGTLSINTASPLTSATVGVVYNQTLTATGGSGTGYSFTLAVGSAALPNGLTISPAGLLSGTPTASGTATFTVQVTDSANTTATKQFQLTVNPSGFSITTATLPNWTQNTAYNQTLTTSGGSAPFSWIVTAGQTPPGLQLANLTGVLSGNPTTLGSFTFTVQVTNAGAITATKQFTIVINSPPSVVASTLPGGVLNTAYTATPTASGGTTPYGWSLLIGQLPAGLTLNVLTGTISGTPTSSGTFPFTLQVTDAAGATATRQFSISIAGSALSVTTNSLTNAVLSTPYSATLAASGGSGSYTWSITQGSLPSGLTIAASTGVISGTPASPGQSTFTATVTDSANTTANRQLTLTVIGASLVITTASLPEAVVSTIYNTSVSATGGSGTGYVWSIAAGSSQLPAGLNLSPSGQISGTPTTAATSNVILQVTDSLGTVATKQFVLAVASSALTITSSSPLPDATQNLPYSTILQASGGVPGSYFFSITNQVLPPGLTMGSNGVISGIPTQAGSFPFTVQVTDGFGGATTKPFTIAVIAPNLTITTTSLPAAGLNNAYSTTLTGSGGTQPYTWSIIIGILPPGLNLNSSTGAITGSPTATGGFNFRVQLRDNQGLTAVSDLSILAVSFGITTNSLPDGQVGVPYNSTLTVVGGAAPYTWSLQTGPLPPGLSLSATGQLTGTPTVQGQYLVTIQVRDGGNSTTTRQFNIVVNGGLSVVTQTLPSGTIGILYDQTLQATGGTPPYTWAVTSGALPVGVTLNSGTGVIRGTPNTIIGSPYQFVVQVTDATNAKSDKLLTITISGPTQTQVQITTQSLPNAVPGTFYSQALAASGGTTPYSWGLSSGVLPAGFSFSSSGVITGTALTSQVGSYSPTFRVTDSANQTATKQLTFIVSSSSSSLTITTQSLPGGNLGAFYSQTLTASGATGSLTWALAGGALPPGFTIATNGVISGTSNSTGTFNFTVQVSDSTNAIARALSISIGSGITILTSSIPAATVNQSYPAQTLQATGGNGVISWSIAAGNTLPPGINFSSSGVLSGFPTTTGTFVFSLRAADTQGNFATQQYTLVIAQTGGTLQITTTSLPNAVLNTLYTANLAATGGVSAGGYTWSVVSGSAPGFTLSSGGVLSGTPTTVGTFPLLVQVRDTANAVAQQSLSLQVVASGGALTISTQTINNPVLNTPYSFSLAATGGTGTYAWSVISGSLPPGITLTAATGLLSGTPTFLGTYNFIIQVFDTLNANSTRQFTVTVSNTGFSILTQTLPNATTGVAYTTTLLPSGGTAPYTWSVTSGALPPGITLTASNGVLAGTTQGTGPFNFTIQLTDATNATAARSFTLQVSTGLTISTTSLPVGSIGAQYNQSLAAAGGTGTGYTWFLTTGSLPPGLNLNFNTGAITGVPTTNGNFTFTVQLTDSAGQQTTRQLTITVGVTLTINQDSLPNGATSSPYNVSLTATGGTAPLLWSVSGDFPPGLALNPTTGAITGTPAIGGNYTFTIRVQDANSNAVTRQYTIAIREGLNITTPTALPGAAEGVIYSQSLSATGGTSPYTWSVSVGSMPPGLNLNVVTGGIAGTPTAIGSYSFIITVTDSQQQTAQKAFTLQVGGRFSIVTPAALPNATVRNPYSETLLATGGATPYTWSLAAGGTPPIGISIERNGVISGTPATAGVFTFTVQVTDNAGATATRTFTLTVVQSVVITTASPLPAGVAGAAYAQSLTATGGQQPYNWTVATGALPSGVTLNATSGVITGVPTAAGTFNFTVQVADNNRTTATASLTIVIALPATPSVIISGLSDVITPAQQPRINIISGAPFPVAINGTLTMTFASDAAVPADDPAVVFTNGTRTLNFVIPANETQAQLPTGFAMQTGTVSGAINLAITLRVGTQDITPSPAPVLTGRVAKAAPTIRQVAARRVASGLEVTITAYATTREVTSAVFRFTGSSLQTTELTVPLTDGAQRWYQSDASRPFGSQFTLTQQFNVTGDTSSITAVSVTLNNAQGASAVSTATFQ